MTNLEKALAALSKASRLEDNSCPPLLKGIVRDIADPSKLMRCRVELQLLSSSSGAYLTDWIPLAFPLKGLLPPALLGSVVIIKALNNSFEELIYEGPGIWRFPLKELPPTVPENLGLQVYVDELEGSLAVCTRRNGRIVWEKLCPLSHLHKSGDHISQGQDSGGDFQQIIQMAATNDDISVTTVQRYYQDSRNFPPSLL